MLKLVGGIFFVVSGVLLMVGRERNVAWQQRMRVARGKPIYRRDVAMAVSYFHGSLFVILGLAIFWSR
jgi:hypothetical protein